MREVDPMLRIEIDIVQLCKKIRANHLWKSALIEGGVRGGGRRSDITSKHYRNWAGFFVEKQIRNGGTLHRFEGALWAMGGRWRWWKSAVLGFFRFQSHLMGAPGAPGGASEAPDSLTRGRGAALDLTAATAAGGGGTLANSASAVGRGTSLRTRPLGYNVALHGHA